MTPLKDTVSVNRDIVTVRNKKERVRDIVSVTVRNDKVGTSSAIPCNTRLPRPSGSQ
jgi:hypothetical protein